jgi:dephospho-CoA kinase
LKVVGLTGGIGSGKSTVAKMFERLDIPIYYSDDEAKNLMNSSKKIRESLIALFGQHTYENGALNRPYVAGLVFHNKNKLNELNAIVHPEVKSNFLEWVARQNTAYVIQENPLIFENKSQNDFDFVITVTAPVQIRVQRVMERDGSTEYQVFSRVKNQLEDEIKINQSDFVITNDDLKDTKDQVRHIHKQLLAQFP